MTQLFSVACRLAEERAIFWKKKKKILITAKSGLAGIKEYLEIHDRVKYFF